MFKNYPMIPYFGFKDENVRTPITFPAQHQPVQPGMEFEMNPLPIFENPNYTPSGKLKDRVVIISGGDSGIGKAVSVLFAKEGADIVISYLNEHEDANYTKQIIESYNENKFLIIICIIYIVVTVFSIMISFNLANIIGNIISLLPLLFVKKYISKYNN